VGSGSGIESNTIMDAGYELFDHTADIGIRARAPTMQGLLRPAAEGLYEVIGELVACGEATPEAWDSVADEPAVLLRDYLAELLVLFERQQRVATKHDVSIFSDQRLAVTAQTRAVDEARSHFEREVKAITYHGLEIVEIEGGYEATIIVDI